MSGNHLPNPIPPRVRRHSSSAQTLIPGPRAAPSSSMVSLRRVQGSMHEGRPYGNGCCPVQAVCALNWASALPRRSDLGRSAALNSRTEDTGSAQCPDRPPTGAPAPRPTTTRPCPRAGPPSVASSYRSYSSGTARPPRAPAAPPWASRRSPRRAGCSFDSRNAGLHSCTVNNAARIVFSTTEAGRKRGTAAAGPGGIRRLADRFQRGTPIIFSQLGPVGPPLPSASPNPLASRVETTRKDASALRGPATELRPTSQQRP